MEVTFADAPESAVQEFEQDMGVRICFGDMGVTTMMSTGILIAIGVVFYLLSLWNLSRKRK